MLTAEDRLAKGAARYGWGRSSSDYGTFYFYCGQAGFEVEFWDNGSVKEMFRLGDQIDTVDHLVTGGYRFLLGFMREHPCRMG
jgi:hypothetical protein